MTKKSSSRSLSERFDESKEYFAQEREQIQQRGFGFIDETFSYKVLGIIRLKLEKLLKPNDYAIMQDEWLRVNVAFRRGLRRKIKSSTRKALLRAIARENSRIISVPIADVAREIVRRERQAFEVIQVRLDDGDEEEIDGIFTALDQAIDGLRDQI